VTSSGITTQEPKQNRASVLSWCLVHNPHAKESALVLALGLGGRGTRRRAFGTVDARSVRATLLAAPKLASTDLLHVRKRELLVIVKVVQDLAIRIAKGEVGRGLEGGHKDGLEDIVDSEGVQAAQSLAGLIHFSKMGVNGALGLKSLGVAVPFYHASDLTSEEDIRLC
jgi:hypothetical protein